MRDVFLMDELDEHNNAKQCEACFAGTCTPETHRYGPDPYVFSSYKSPDRSDKRSNESWTEYWGRKRRELHGDKCKCYVCVLDELDAADEADKALADMMRNGPACGHSFVTCHTNRCFVRQTNEDGPIEVEEL